MPEISHARLAADLRTHAYERSVVSPEVTAALWETADQLDGGVARNVHHGCPDDSVPARECRESHLVVSTEVEMGGRSSIWTTVN